MGRFKATVPSRSRSRWSTATRYRRPFSILSCRRESITSLHELWRKIPLNVINAARRWCWISSTCRKDESRGARQSSQVRPRAEAQAKRRMKEPNHPWANRGLPRNPRQIRALCFRGTVQRRTCWRRCGRDLLQVSSDLNERAKSSLGQPGVAAKPQANTRALLPGDGAAKNLLEKMRKRSIAGVLVLAALFIFGLWVISFGPQGVRPRAAEPLTLTRAV